MRPKAILSFVAAAACALLLIWGARGVWRFHHRALQVRTFANMQFISAAINAMSREKGEVTEADVIEAARSVNGGLDAWGHHYLVLFRGNDACAPRYLLISLGRDGALDVADPASYLQAGEYDVAYIYDSDIVFIDGRPLTLAGK